MSTLPELAARIRRVSDMMAVRTGWKSELEAIAAEMRHQPQPVNAELLTAAKNRLLSCADGGDCADAALMVGEFCSNECSALSRAIASAESVEKAPAQGCDRYWLKREDCAACQKLSAADSDAAQPDVVSGLLAALRKIRDHQTFSPAGVAKDALAAFEAQSKAEPKA